MKYSFKKINKKYTVVSLLCTLCFRFAFSQAQGPALLQVVKPSPNTAALEKYGDIPVSPFTGVPEISIPIYTITSGDISLPISLSYHASGIKVSEEASRVGLGWVLNAGGEISRNIIGYDDFLDNGYCTANGSHIRNYDKGQQPIALVQTGDTLRCINLSQPQLPTLYSDNLTLYLDPSLFYDFQPDQYYYNLPNKTGKFNLNRNRTVNLQKLEGIQISVMDDAANTWQIKTEDGFIYDFTEKETYQENNASSKTHCSAWYLTKITSPTNNSIILKYKHIPAINSIQTVGAYFESRDDARTLPQFSDGTVIIPMTNPRQYGEIFGKVYSAALLDTIFFNNGFVKFNYSNRLDLPGDQKLDSVNVYSLNSSNQNISLLKSTQFSYDYFTSPKYISPWIYTSSYGNPLQRLKLLKATEKGYLNNRLDSTNNYTFSYYDDGAYFVLPPKNYFGKDHWGYYNGKTNTSFIPTYTPVASQDWVTFSLGTMGHERDPDTNFVKAGSLRLIKYNSGGSTEFQYESNDFDEQLSQKNDFSYFKSRPVLVAKSASQLYDVSVGNHFVTTDTLDLSDGYSDKSGHSYPGVQAHMTVTYRFSRALSCPATFRETNILFTILDSNGHNTTYFTKDLADFNSCASSPVYPCATCNSNTVIYQTDLSLMPGKYTIKVTVNQAYANSVNLQDIRFYTTYNAMVNSDSVNYNNNTTFAYGGGLRIKRIIDHDGADPSKDKIRHYMYHYQADKNKDGINEEYSYGIRMSKPNYSYFVLTSDITIVHLLNGGTNTYYYYTMHLTRSAESNTQLNGYSGNYAVGYSQVTELFGENGENGKTVYQYYNEPDYVNAYNDPLFGYPLMPPYGSNYADPLNSSLLKQTKYKKVNNVFYKLSETTNSYFSSFKANNSLEYYNYGIQPVMINRNFSVDGSSSSQPGLNGDDFLLSYIALNSEWTYLNNSMERTFDGNDTTKYLDVVTTYSYGNTRHLLPTQITRTTSNGKTFITNYKYPLDFDVSGTANNNISLGIQNLQNKHILSPVIERYVQLSSGGQAPQTIAGTFTSFKPAAPLSDTIFSLASASPLANFNPSAITAGAATRDANYKPNVLLNTYDAHGNILEQQKASDVKEVYLWGYNSVYPVAKITGSDFNTVKAKVDTAVLSHGTDAQIRQQLTNLRNAFAPSPLVQVWTYTYAPLIGMTSETDPKGNTVYYEYDGFGRLIDAKDKDGNVLKKYNYHYQGQ